MLLIMKNKIRSIVVFFFTFFGGILILKTLFHVVILGNSLNWRDEIVDTAFIAAFVAFFWVMLNGYRFNVKK